MIVYINVKNGKVDLTKEELEKLLANKYKEGYEEGKRWGNKPYITWTSNRCPYGDYWNCPYYWTNQPYVTWISSNSSDSSLNINGASTCSDSITSTTETVTINYNEVS